MIKDHGFICFSTKEVNTIYQLCIDFEYYGGVGKVTYDEVEALRKAIEEVLEVDKQEPEGEDA